jgi:hypothetical protein
MERIVKHLEKKALSGTELQEALNHCVNVVAYHELEGIHNLDQIMTLPNGYRSKACVILYESSYNNGHYTCLLEYPDYWLFFDPYGSKKIDEELEYSTFDDNQRVHLLDLLRSQRKPFKTSMEQYQKDGPGINTCGRHCIARIKMHDLTEQEYKNVMKGNSDEKAVLLTMLSTDLP